MIKKLRECDTPHAVFFTSSRLFSCHHHVECTCSFVWLSMYHVNCAIKRVHLTNKCFINEHLPFYQSIQFKSSVCWCYRERNSVKTLFRKIITNSNHCQWKSYNILITDYDLHLPLAMIQYKISFWIWK